MGWRATRPTAAPREPARREKDLPASAVGRGRACMISASSAKGTVPRRDEPSQNGPETVTRRPRRTRKVPPKPVVERPAGTLAGGMPWVLAAVVAVVAFYLSLRIVAPQPWSYDEYYHLGLAREMRSDFRIESFRWTPFSI